MACRTAITTVVSHEEPANVGSSLRSNSEHQEHSLQRRHSSYHTEPWIADFDNVQLLVEQFLGELERRLDFLETFGKLNIDNGVERAYTTLHAVRESCSHVSDELIGASRRKAKVMIDTLEERYNDALATKETMEQKVQEGVRIMEAFLSDCESRAYAIRDTRLAKANELIDEGWRRVDSGLERAREVVDDGMDKARRAKYALTRKIEVAVAEAKEHGLIAYEDLPHPWRINPHVLHGYRFSETKLECFKSMFGFSNETVNIWSHLIGLIIVMSIAFYFYPTSKTFSVSSNADVIIAIMFMAAACKCLLCSTLWHTMNSISDVSMMERFACVDYTGISLLVATSIMTTEYTAFYCEPISRWIYMVLTFVLGVGGTILPWHPTFNRNDMAWARVGFYVSLAATGFFPVFQLTYERGWNWMTYFYAPVVKSIGVYLGGALLYAAKIPERWRPGMFDYVGGSHNIWHLAVLGGILFHYSAMHEFFQKAFLRQGTTQCSVY